MKRKGIGSHTNPNNGESDDWITPPDIVRALGRFSLDPCASQKMFYRTASHMICQPADGLNESWHGRVWLNPPYSEAALWLAKLAAHGRGTALVFARTETKMFAEHVWPHFSAIKFLTGRLHFYRPDGTRSKGNSGGPSVLIAYGERDAQILNESDLPGIVLIPLLSLPRLSNAASPCPSGHSCGRSSTRPSVPAARPPSLDRRP